MQRFISLMLLVFCLSVATGASPETEALAPSLFLSGTEVTVLVSQAIEDAVSRGYGVKASLSLSAIGEEGELLIEGVVASSTPEKYRVVYTSPEDMAGGKTYWFNPVSAQQPLRKSHRVSEMEPFPLQAVLELLLVPEVWREEQLKTEVQLGPGSSEDLVVVGFLVEGTGLAGQVTVSRDTFLPHSLTFEMEGLGTQVLSSIRYLPIDSETLRYTPLEEFREAYLEGLDLMRKGEHEEAVPLFRRLVQIDPYNLSAHANLGFCYSELNDEGLAIGEFEQMLMLDPNCALALNNLAYLYIDSDLYVEKGLSMAKKAVEMEPENGAFLDTLGWGYFKTGNFHRASLELERALSSQDDTAKNATIHYHLAMVYWQLGKEDLAMIHLGKALELDPELEEAKEQLGLIEGTVEHEY